MQPEDLQLASGMITPHLGEFIVEEGGFNPGMTGVMQLIAMIEIDQALRNRKR